MKPPPDPHLLHRFPAEAISHTVSLYRVFSLSLRDVELILAEPSFIRVNSQGTNPNRITAAQAADTVSN
jgi:transposase-like protein